MDGWDKTKVRQSFRRMRREFLSRVNKGEVDRALCRNLAEVLPVASSSLIASYKALSSEACPAHLQQMHPQAQWAFPYVDADDILFLVPNDFESGFVTSSWGILEPDPKSSKRVDINELAAVLVPGVAFDRQGRRLGSGKGFYDRALADFQGLKIGVAYSTQLSHQELPHEAHDVSMDYVVTEEFVFQPLRRPTSTVPATGN